MAPPKSRSSSGNRSGGKSAGKPSATGKPSGAPKRGRDGYRPRPQDAEKPALPEQLPMYPGAVSVVLRPGTATPLLAGHPWLFSGAVAHIVPGTGLDPAALPAGVACAVFDQHSRFLGAGAYNAQSQIAVRMLAPGLDGLEPPTLPSHASLLRLRLQQAAAMRQQIGLPSAQTNAYRLCNSEGDQLPGLTIDVFGAGDQRGAVAQLTAAWLWPLRDALWQALQRQHACHWLLIRIPQDVHPSEGLTGGEQLRFGEPPEQLEVLHNGLRLRVEPAGGQKTGMYCDQRDNHARVAELARGRFVLDTFCHTGGFGLHASRAGASKVEAVDASQRAIDLALQHADDNGLGGYHAQAADAVHILRHYAELPMEDQAGRPDLVIVDPPKFAARAAVLDQAVKKYTHLNAQAMQAVRDGGLLVTCSCSGLVTREAFLRILGQAALQAGRSVQLLELRGPACDHPVAPAHAEGHYLKVAICRITPRDAGLNG
jgi:23S rRNA (cytosine1962-C5)-methyltransferase